MRNENALTKQEAGWTPTVIGRTALAPAKKVLTLSNLWADYGGVVLGRMIESTAPLPPPSVNLERLDNLGCLMRAFESIRYSLASILHATDYTRRGWLFQFRFLLGGLVWLAIPLAILGVLLWGGIWLFGELSNLLGKAVSCLLWGLLVLFLFFVIWAALKVIPRLLKQL